MKYQSRAIYFVGLLASLLLVVSCKKFEADVLPMNNIDVGGVESYASVEENSFLTIPVRFSSLCDSGIATAGYKVVSHRGALATSVVMSPLVPIPFQNKTVETTLKVPVRQGLTAVVIQIYDKDGRLSSKSIDVENVVPSSAPVKTFTGLTMSTDPADNQNFISFYEANPVFGSSTALTKQSRVDLMLVNMNGARFISPNAYGAGATYYDASKAALAGFTSLSYAFLSSSRAYINRSNFDAISTEAQLTKFFDDSVIAIPPKGGAYYNLINADRRVSDVYGVSTATRGFIFGWGYRSHPTSTAVILNESFGMILVTGVTRKGNGHFVITFDAKVPSFDQRDSYSATPIEPYSPYPL